MNEILRTSIAYWESAVLFSALRLSLFEKLGENPSTPEEIARICNSETDPVSRILRALAAMKLLVRENDRYYCTPETIDSLIPGRDKNLTHFCRIMGEDFAHGLWLDLTKSGQRFDPIPQIVNESPVSHEVFTMGMQNLAQLGEAEALVSHTDLSEAKNLLDLGCGSGAYSIALCRKNPHLQGVVVDLPEVTAVTRKIIDENELDERIRVISKNWEEVDYSEEFDAVLLSDVLYRSAESCKKLIETVFAALQPGGQIIIRGYFLDDTDDRLFPALFDINLSRNSSGQKNPEIDEVKGWLEEAGFEVTSAGHLTEMSSLITGIKPSGRENNHSN